MALTLQVHARALQHSTAGELAGELGICAAQGDALSGEAKAAVAALEAAALSAAPDDIKALVLLGHVHTRAGDAPAATAAYEAALKKAPRACPLDVYIRLGNAYLAAGQLQYAVDVFGQACMVRPCASSWLGAGTAYLRMGALADADLALTEANIHDNQNPVVWGYLALVQVLAEQHSEAEQVCFGACVPRLWVTTAHLCVGEVAGCMDDAFAH